MAKPTERKKKRLNVIVACWPSTLDQVSWQGWALESLQGFFFPYYLQEQAWKKYLYNVFGR
jgi:hypothetical protein